MPTDSLHVVIIGAGYAGLALAHALGRAGVSCAVYEAQPSCTDCLEDQVHFGKEFTRYDQQTDGTVTALFADGSSASGQVLVAADGAHSPVRAQYLPQAVPEPPVTPFRPQIALAAPLPAWRSSNITLVGDAIHPMGTGQQVGANTALRDAMLLSHALAAVQDGRVGLLNAISAYEAEAIRSGSPRAGRCLPGNAIADSDPFHQPLDGRAVLAAGRAWLAAAAGPVANWAAPLRWNA
jgi:2-polyprenyl-6-methoxyphenol hydroxylase-like FAD-dependent oxidoreductase